MNASLPITLQSRGLFFLTLASIPLGLFNLWNACRRADDDITLLLALFVAALVALLGAAWLHSMKFELTDAGVIRTQWLGLGRRSRFDFSDLTSIKVPKDGAGMKLCFRKGNVRLFRAQTGFQEALDFMRAKFPARFEPTI